MNQKEDKYPEIIALKRFCKEKNCFTKQADSSYNIHPYLTPILLFIGNEEVLIQVQDEYEDLFKDNVLLNVILCLQELELVEDSTDYLNWLQLQSIEKSTESLRLYYQNMVKTVSKLRVQFPNNRITAFIPDLDYQLNSNSMYYLRKK
ncbi:hypothetical protein [Pseudofulvibacter geojedonensis]